MSLPGVDSRLSLPAVVLYKEVNSVALADDVRISVDSDISVMKCCCSGSKMRKIKGGLRVLFKNVK